MTTTDVDRPLVQKAADELEDHIPEIHHPIAGTEDETTVETVNAAEITAQDHDPNPVTHLAAIAAIPAEVTVGIQIPVTTITVVEGHQTTTVMEIATRSEKTIIDAAMMAEIAAIVNETVAMTECEMIAEVKIGTEIEEVAITAVVAQGVPITTTETSAGVQRWSNLPQANEEIK